MGWDSKNKFGYQRVLITVSALYLAKLLLGPGLFDVGTTRAIGMSNAEAMETILEFMT